jgi:hypothetical protein
MFAYTDTSGKPCFMPSTGRTTRSISTARLDFAYSFRFRYQGKFALSDTFPTNQLLADHPDIYLAGAIVWGSIFVEDDAKIMKWSQMLSGFMDEAKHVLAKSRRGRLQPDPGLSEIVHNRNLPLLAAR